MQDLKLTQKKMDELAIAAHLVAERLKTDYPFVLKNLDEFYDRLDTWKKEYSSPGSISKAKFEIFRKAYPGVKRGLEVEYANFLNKHKKEHAEIIEQLLPALQREIAYHKRCQLENKFCPEYQHLRTWINNRSWENVFPEPISKMASSPVSYGG